MPKDLIAAKSTFKALKEEEFKAHSSKEQISLVTRFINLATTAENERRTYPPELKQELASLIEQVYLEAQGRLINLRRPLSKADPELSKIFHLLTLRLSAHYLREEEHTKATQVFDLCLEDSHPFPLPAGNSKLEQKAAEALLTKASRFITNSSSSPLTQSQSLDLENLISKGLHFILKATLKGNLKTTSYLALYFNQLQPFSENITIYQPSLIPALQHKVEPPLLPLKARQVLGFLIENYRHYHHVNMFSSITHDLKTHLRSSYRGMLDELANQTKNNADLAHLVDDLGYPLDLNFEEHGDLFTLIYAHPNLGIPQKEALIEFLCSRGFQFKMNLPFPKEWHSPQHSEAKIISDTVLEGVDDKHSMNPLITSYLGIDNNAGNNGAFFQQNKGDTRKRKMDKPLTTEEESKNEDNPDKAQKMDPNTQKEEAADSQQLGTRLISQNNSQVSTDIEQDTQMRPKSSF